MIVYYLLDTNIFIQAKNTNFDFDVCPEFWVWLEERNADRTVASISAVREELEAGNDQLADWAKRQDDEFFLNPDDEVISFHQFVVNWVTNRGFQPRHRDRFLDGADPWLVLYARVTGGIIVTTLKRLKYPLSAMLLILNVYFPMKCSNVQGQTSF